MGEQAGPKLVHSVEKLSLRHDTPAGPESAHFEGGAGVETSALARNDPPVLMRNSPGRFRAARVAGR
jgi:hypothetical protein